MPATRTQVYFSEEQRRSLDAVARRDNRTLAAVVRAAVDAYLAQAPPELEDALDQTFGSIPDLDISVNRDWDRGYG